MPGALVSMAAPPLFFPAPLTTLPWLMALLRPVDVAVPPVVINAGLWSCASIPDSLCFKGKTMEQSFYLAVLGSWGQGLAAGKAFAKNAQLLGCFPT